MEKRSSLLILTWLLSSTAFTETFRDYLSKQFEEQKILVPNFQEGENLEAKAVSMPELRATRFFRLYETFIGKKPVTWTQVDVGESFLVPPAGPAQKFYNKSLLWARDEKKNLLWGFRPIETTTGCQSGCTSVVFHLVINPQGEAVAILQEKARPLRKTGHAELSPAELAKLLDLAKKLPDSLNDINDPALVADEKSVFPAQTWTAFKDLLVPGAAYTSYRVFEVALKTKESLKKTNGEASMASLALFSEMMHLEDRESAETFVRTLRGELGKSPNPARRQLIFNFGPELLLWLGQEGSDIKALSESFFGAPEFRGSRLQSFCSFQEKLLSFKSGQELLLEIDARPQQWPLCSAETSKSFAFLAAALLGRTGLLKKKTEHISFDALPPFIMTEAPLLHAAQIAAHELKLRSSEIALAAQLDRRFPRWKASTDTLKLQDSERAAFMTAQKNAEAEIRAEIRRSFLLENRSLPAATLKAWQSKKSLSIPTKEERLYVFFATWCPHCQKTFSRWMEAKIPESILKKIVFIEIFGRGEASAIPEFCKTTRMPEALCKQIWKGPSMESARSFYSDLALVGVPRMVLTNRQGQIVHLNWIFKDLPGKDLAIELERLLAEARDFNGAREVAPANESKSASRSSSYNLKWISMGSPWTVSANAPQMSLEAGLVNEMLTRDSLLFDETFSAWSDVSELRRLERGGLVKADRSMSPLFRWGFELGEKFLVESAGRFDFRMARLQWKSGNHQLSFDGFIKGAAVGSLSRRLADAGFDSFRVDAGGGNLAWKGQGPHGAWIDSEQSAVEKMRRDLNAPDSALWMLSRSRTTQHGRQHIFDPRHPGLFLNGQSLVLCFENDPRKWIESAARNDMLSKTVLIDPHYPALPANCRASIN